MDLNELKGQVKKVKAPVPGGGSLDDRPVDDLVAVLKAEDAKDARTFRRSMVFFAIAGIFYVGVFVLTWIAPPDESPNLHRVMLSMFGFVFLSLGIYSRMKWRELAGVMYTEPVRHFLVDAERRYRFLSVRELMVLVPYLVILTITCTVALMTGFERYLPGLDPAVGLLICSVFFPAMWAAGFALGWREWRRRKEPLLKAIRAMLSDLTIEEGVSE